MPSFRQVVQNVSGTGMEKKCIVEGLDKALKPAGFRRKSANWYRDRPETIQMVNLQKSNFGMQFYVNLAVAVRALVDNAEPKEHRCHIRERLGSLAGDCSPFVRALDLDSSLSCDQRAELVADMISQLGLPFFDRLDSVDRIRHEYSRGTLRGAAVQGIRELLAEPP